MKMGVQLLKNDTVQITRAGFVKASYCYLGYPWPLALGFVGFVIAFASPKILGLFCTHTES